MAKALVPWKIHLCLRFDTPASLGKLMRLLLTLSPVEQNERLATMDGSGYCRRLHRAPSSLRGA